MNSLARASDLQKRLCHLRGVLWRRLTFEPRAARSCLDCKRLMQVSNKNVYENSPIDCTKRSSLSVSETRSPKGGQFDPDIQVDAQSADRCTDACARYRDDAGGSAVA